VLAALLYLALLVNLFFACSSAWSGGGCIKDIGSPVEEAWYESKECGWPLTYYLETKEGCFEQAKRTSDWQITGLVADGLLCLALAIALYWLVVASLARCGGGFLDTPSIPTTMPLLRTREDVFGGTLALRLCSLRQSLR
ncbi:MAG: hypothetical protein J7M16_06505, partial [Anaerolineae bacterium]|nr:hypothetical protein [Anaerolineae bacterium]